MTAPLVPFEDHWPDSDQMREDAQLGAAWRRCETALPEGWVIEGLSWERGKDGAPSQAFPDQWHARAFSWTPTARRIYGKPGPTPTAALNALAEKLEAMK